MYIYIYISWTINIDTMLKIKIICMRIFFFENSQQCIVN